ncbi:MAG: polyprenyl synthetase family protein [Paracoccaceae bacterium]
MPLTSRIEGAIADAMLAPGGPRGLAGAMAHATAPGGARIRPTILLSVALACGDDRPEASNAAAAALELIHCASLVHDDMPCFDDAATRRGRPSVHRQYGEALAVLAGDALIVRAFGHLAARAGDRAGGLIAQLAHRTGAPHGICAGQGWESERAIDLSAYHRAKTGALFMAATQMGAASAGHDPAPWEELGDRIGEAFQVADDLRDAVCEPAEIGKPAGQDATHGRPNAVARLGLRGAVARLDDILAGAISSIPACRGEAALAHLVRATAARLVPDAARRALIAGE